MESTNIKFIKGQVLTADDLNNLQALLQTQIGRFADHIFKDGTKVHGGEISILPVDYIKTANPLSGSIVGTNTGLTAIVTGNSNGYNFIQYTNSGTDKNTFKFPLLETIGTESVTKVGTGLQLKVNEGIFYINQRFIKIDPVDAFISDVTNPENLVVGFLVSEEQISVAINNPFNIKLVEYKDGSLEYILNDTAYSDIMDMLANRTYETNGNFLVSPVTVSVDPDYNLKVSPINAYILGYNTKKLSDTKIALNKSLSTRSVTNVTINKESLPYIIVTYSYMNLGQKRYYNLTPNDVYQVYDSNNNLVTSINVQGFVLESHSDKLNYFHKYRMYYTSVDYPNGLPKERYNFKAANYTDKYILQTDDGFLKNDIRTVSGQYFDLSENYASLSNVSVNRLMTVEGVAIDTLGTYTFNAPNGYSFTDVKNGNMGLKIEDSGNLLGITETFYSVEYVSPSTVILKDSSFNISVIGNHAVCSFILKSDYIEPLTKTLTRNTITFSDINTVKLPADTLRIISAIKTSNGIDYDITSHIKLVNHDTHEYYNYNTLVCDDSFIVGDTVSITFDWFKWSGNNTYTTINSYNLNSPVAYDLSEVKNLNRVDFRSNLWNGLTQETFETIKLTIDPTITFDGLIYNSRVDVLTINKDGNILINEGVPSSNPIQKHVSSNDLILAVIYVPAGYQSSNNVLLSINDSVRYTMQDIRKLDNTISAVKKDLELTKLELNALAMEVIGKDGITRNKSGIYTDSLETLNTESKGSVRNGTFYPAFDLYNVPLTINTSKTILALNAFPVTALEQPVFTDSVSVNPYDSYRKNGELTLHPNMDVWSDSINPPTVTHSSTSETTTIWGQWSEYNKIIGQIPIILPNRTINQVLVESGITRNGKEVTTTTNVDTYTTESVKGVSIAPFMRECTILLACVNMRPLSKMYVYMDGESIGGLVTPLNSFKGDTLYSDNLGRVVGYINFPENTYYTGSKKIVVSNAPDYSLLNDYDSYAECLFYSGGASITKDTKVTKLFTPTVSSKDVTESKMTGIESRIFVDPIAQSFALSMNAVIDSIEIDFESKGNADIECRLVSMLNGYPTRDVLAVSKLSDVSLTGYTKFTFDPVQLLADTEYAFVLVSSSSDYRVKVATVGLPYNGSIVSKQTTLGSFFKSQNGSTWTADQNKDIKYKLNVLKLTNLTNTLTLYDTKAFNDYVKVTSIKKTMGSDKCLLSIKNARFDNNTTVKLVPIEQQITINNPVGLTCYPVGSVVTSANASGVIKSVISGNTIVLGDLTAKFNVLDSITVSGTLSGNVGNLDSSIVSGILGTGFNTTTFTQSNTVVSSTLDYSLPYGSYTIINNAITLPSNSVINTVINTDNLKIVAPLKYDIFNLSGIYSFTFGRVSASTKTTKGTIEHGLKNDVSYNGLFYPNGTSYPVGITKSFETTLTFISDTFYDVPIINTKSFSATLVKQKTSEYVSDVIEGIDVSRDVKLVFNASIPVNARLSLYYKDTDWHLLTDNFKSSNGIEYNVSFSDYSSDFSNSSKNYFTVETVNAMLPYLTTLEAEELLNKDVAGFKSIQFKLVLSSVDDVQYPSISSIKCLCLM